MNSMQLNRYLEYLTTKGFLESRPSEEKGTAVFQITPKGGELLGQIEGLLDVLELEDPIAAMIK